MQVEVIVKLDGQKNVQVWIRGVDGQDGEGLLLMPGQHYVIDSSEISPGLAFVKNDTMPSPEEERAKMLEELRLGEDPDDDD